MKDLSYLLVLTFSIALAISTAKPLKPFREFVSKRSTVMGPFFSCAKCMSFYLSVPVGYWIYRQWSWNMIAFAFLAFGFSSLAELIFTKLR